MVDRQQVDKARMMSDRPLVMGTTKGALTTERTHAREQLRPLGKQASRSYEGMSISLVTTDHE
jgi:hypothetical protein